MTTPEEIAAEMQPQRAREHWLVYSREHNAFWAPNQHGYTTSIEKAGRYTGAHAFHICVGSNQCCQEDDPSEIAVVDPMALVDYAAEISTLTLDLAEAKRQLTEAGTTLTNAEVAANNQMFHELTAELADAKRQLAIKDAEIQRLVDALDDLLPMMADEGCLHSDRCGCEFCETVARAKLAVKETTNPAPPTSPECERVAKARAALQENAG